MKKSMLLVGAFLTVAAMAQAKEVVPAPVVVEEAPVQIVEKEVIVYRDKEEGFRPNGNVSLEYRYYGNTEGHEENKGIDSWNGNNDYSRLQLLGNINMTEKQTLEYRVRSYNSLSQHDVTNPTSKKNATETRLRHYYDLGTIGDSNIGMSTYAQYKHTTGGEQQIITDLRFDFTDYFFDNEFIKTTKAEVGPSYMYTWSDGNDSNYSNAVGFYFDFLNQLPYGFSFEVKSDDDASYYYMYGQDGKEDEFVFRLAAYLNHDANLYTNGKYALDWHFEGGYDPYTWSSRELFAPGSDSKRSYELYMQPNLILSYQATEFITLKGTVGAEYRNWSNTNETSAQTWRWQPYVAVGFNVAF